jgi:formamidopyrimidine-DNA glycosylase
MPELPEVEITMRAITPFLEGETVSGVTARNVRLRMSIPAELIGKLPGLVILKVERRAKYLLLRATSGSVILHLGMSGSLEVVPASRPPGKHDHLDIVLENGLALRFNDPRRFGMVLWTNGDPLNHPLLKGVGPEPLEECFTGEHLFRKSRGRMVTVKQFLMDARMVAGIGNIYASESLFSAGIHPERRAGEISMIRYRRLAGAIREVLTQAIALGEMELKEWDGNGEIPTRFPLTLDVYRRGGEPCNRCGAPIRRIRIGGRSTFFCGRCQR